MCGVSLLSHVFVVFVLCVLPRLPDSDKKFFFFDDGLNKVLTQGDFCTVPECQSDVNSNKRGCGTPAQAQTSARVDMPTARVFPVWTKETNMSDTCSPFNRPRS